MLTLVSFVLVVAWLVGTLNLVFGWPLGTLVAAALFLLGGAWAAVRAKESSKRAGGLSAVVVEARSLAREVRRGAERRGST